MQTNTQRMANFVIFVGLIFPLVLGIAWTSERMSHFFCAPDAFLVGSTRPTLRLVGVVFASLPLVYLIRGALLERVPFFRGIIGHSHKRTKPRGRDWSLFVNGGLAVTSASGFVILAVAAASPFCLSAREISDRASPWHAALRHDWQDVAEIHTFCSVGARGSWNVHFVIVTRDGDAIDVLENGWHFAAAYPALRAALANSNFAFDTHFSPKKCGYDHAQMLTTRP